MLLLRTAFLTASRAALRKRLSYCGTFLILRFVIKLSKNFERGSFLLRQLFELSDAIKDFGSLETVTILNNKAFLISMTFASFVLLLFRRSFFGRVDSFG